jgi:hypothetical protein
LLHQLGGLLDPFIKAGLVSGTWLLRGSDHGIYFVEAFTQEFKKQMQKCPKPLNEKMRQKLASSLLGFDHGNKRSNPILTIYNKKALNVSLQF